jgi:hypothetical protein
MTSVVIDTNSAKSVEVDDARAVRLEVTGLERRLADVAERRLENGGQLYYYPHGVVDIVAVSAGGATLPPSTSNPIKTNRNRRSN